MHYTEIVEYWTALVPKPLAHTTPAIPELQNLGRLVRHPTSYDLPYAGSTARVIAKVNSYPTETRTIEISPATPNFTPPTRAVQGRQLISALTGRLGCTRPAAAPERVMKTHMAELAELVEEFLRADAASSVS
jgi:hypothetical protein